MMAWLLYELLSPFVPHRRPKSRPPAVSMADAQMEFDLALACARWRAEVRELRELFELPARQPARSAG